MTKLHKKEERQSDLEVSLVHFENTLCVLPCAVTVLVVQEHIHRKSQNSVLKLAVSFLSVGHVWKNALDWKVDHIHWTHFSSLEWKGVWLLALKDFPVIRTRKDHSNIYTQSLKGYCIRFSSHVLCTTFGKKLDVIILKRERGSRDYGLDC